MTVSPKALEEYKAIYRKNFGKDISDADALEQATKLLRLMEIVYKPMTKEEYNEITKLNEKTMKADDTSEKEGTDKLAQELTDNLNKNVGESVARGERYEKIYAIERTKWPHGMGAKMRDEIPENLQAELEECIIRSQNIARDACQTEELTNAYLAEN